eukprot:scaffold113604_cov13-Tisochrysis_lutea.AAC.1
MPVMPGQKIKTDTPLVKKAREGVMEFLLVSAVQAGKHRLHMLASMSCSSAGAPVHSHGHTSLCLCVPVLMVDQPVSMWYPYACRNVRDVEMFL